jgi:signal transduction histidine kinase
MARQCNVEEPTPLRIEMRRLLDRQLRVPLVAVVEPAHPGFKAHTAGMSVFGYGDDVVEALEVLKEGIESIYRDEEFPDVRAVIRGMLLPEDHMADRERHARKDESIAASQLLQARKTETTGMLAGGMAHHFNNILMTVMGSANLLQMKMDPADPLRVYVDHIFASAGKAAKLVQDLLAFSGKQAIELKPYKVGFLVRNASMLLRRLLPENIEFETIISDDGTVMADMALINQALVSLTTNARDAMPQGGRLRIETKRAEIDDAFEKAHGYGKPGTYALVSVADTGIGMHENTCRKAFDPFFTTKEVGRGTGLGLSTVYGIVKQHGGYVTAWSEPGVGTTFHIYLPASD